MSGFQLPDFSTRILEDSVDVTADTTSGAVQNDSVRADSVGMAKEKAALKDSLAVDSTARLKYFHYQRNDVPYVQFRQKKRSKFFTYPSQSTAVRSVEIDSTGQFVVIREKIAGKDSRVLLQVPIDEFIQMRLDAKNRELWEALAYEYELKEGKKDAGEVLTSITNIDIPLPSAGFLSIFGPPKINLRIGGSVDIHGAWRNEKTEGVTTSVFGNSRSEPDFKQQVQVNVNGTIGDKLKISADWNTERTFEYENQLKLEYTGYEDEIVQRVEAGNVSLQTSPLVGGSEALFGVKAEFQLGPLSLTTLASQKKGEVKEVSISGGSTTNTFERRVYDYSTNHYFIDKIYADTSAQYNLFNKYYANPTPELNPKYYVREIEVWKSVVGQVDKSKERVAVALIDLPEKRIGNYDELRTSTSTSGKIARGRFVKLSPSEYDLHSETGFISFKSNIQSSDIIAVAYKREAPTSDSPEDYLVYGDFLDETDDSVLVLKLVKPENLQPQDTLAWNLQLRNIYPTGGRGVNREGFELDIVYAEPGAEPVRELSIGGNTYPLLNLFGLDRYSGDDAAGQDGAFDFKPGRTIMPETGEVIFPYLQPFGMNLPNPLKQGGPNGASLAYDEVYTTTTTQAKNKSEKDRFVIRGKYSAATTDRFNLGFVGVVENSVKVTLNGRELSEGIDYVVDYNIGQVIIKNQAALVQGAGLKISYEQNDIFQLASKTLVGARGEMNLSKKTRFGFSALNLNQQTLSDKVRIGEEPLNNSIYGLDLTTSMDLPFLTKGINNLISTREMSSLALRGEFAYINPDPNTKKSTIASDKGQSIAYIDDFEGTKKIIPLGVSGASWRDISVPDEMELIGNLSKSRQMDYKAKSYWYNNPVRDTRTEDIWPLKRVKRGEDLVTVLDFVYNPNNKGPYNKSQEFTASPNNWAGMMKLVSSAANNLVDENIEFVEFWMKIVEAPEGAKLYMDLGEISEDVIPDGKLNTEDFNNNDNVDQNEDVGLDGIPDGQEPGSSASNPDGAGDNFGYSQGNGNFYTINNTEGNSQYLEGGRLPDTEDLNRNGTLDDLNRYFRYEIPLDTNSVTNPLITGGGSKGWYQVRIPLKDANSEYGSPTLSVVEAIRLWVNGVNGPVRLRFADMNLVGNQWEKLNKSDTVIVLSVVNIEDNPGYYKSPEGVQREKDRSDPNDIIERNEQSLSIMINGLKPGDSRYAIKRFRSVNLFNYKVMKLFVHGDEPSADNNLTTFNLSDSTNHAGEVFFRFGSDTLNYYEYSMPVTEGWQEMEIPFSEMTSLKQVRDTSKIFSLDIPGKPGHYYRVKGQPALTNISTFFVGVRNPGKTGETMHGQVWVNELRVIGADNSKGWAYSSSASLKIADIMTVNFNMSQTNPYFHRIADRFGSYNDTRNWGVNVGVDLLKLLPFKSAGSNLRLDYSRTEQVTKPLYQPGTDIKVDEAAKQLTRKLVETENYSESEAKKAADQFVDNTYTLNVTDTYTLSNIRLRIPTQYWLVKHTFNSLTFNFNYNHSTSRNPTILRTSNWGWNAAANYALNFSQNNFFYPAKIPVFGSILQMFKDYRNVKVYFSPQSFNWNFTANRSHGFNQQRTIGARPSISRDFRTSRSADVNWKVTEGGLLNLGLTYGMDVTSSLAHYLKLTEQIDRSERDIWSDIISGGFFGRDYDFSQVFDVKTNPKLPSIWKLNNYFTVNAGYRVNYSWRNDMSQPELGRSAGYNNSINAGLNLKLKALVAPLFQDDNKQQGSSIKLTTPGRGRNTGNTKPGGTGTDSLSARTDSVKASSGPSSLRTALFFFKGVMRYVLFDYETISVNFTQSNSLSKSGLRGVGSGFANFWGITEKDRRGPSRGFMLGLSSDAGRRAPRANLNDVYNNTNSLEMRTSRPLWEGASIDIRWKVGWSVSKSTPLVTDEFGNVYLKAATTTGSIDRSFVSFPPVFFLSMLKSGIKNVHELYDPKKNNMNEAFLEGFETLPLVSKLPLLKDVARYIPRPNWTLNWNGLEKYSIFKSFAKQVSLSHSYAANYTEAWKVDVQSGKEVVQNQKISYGFQPLVGLNLTFNSLWGGNFSGQAKYSTRTGYDLSNSNRESISESFNRDVGISLSFSKTGFDIPLFGLSFKNNIEFSVAYSNSKNSVVLYNMRDFKEEGVPQDGTIRTSLEPRMKLVMSQKLTLSLYYKRATVKPEGAAKIPPTTTTEAGLDVNITIN